MTKLKTTTKQQPPNDFTFAHREEGFDVHIDNSIRGYGDLHNDVINLSRYFVEDYTKVVDIGCSTGKTIEAMKAQNYTHSQFARYVGVENAIGFADEINKTSQRMKDKFPNGDVDFCNIDIVNYEFNNCSLVTSLFTLQFMPVRSRRTVLGSIYRGLNEGGAFIFAEKTLSENSKIQEMMTFTYYDFKRQHFDEKDIMNKERTLRNMLKPNTWQEISNSLRSVGFKSVQPFWQNFLFVGAIAIK